ncbi:MAG: phage head closure protein [Planctomycetota bacterium]
MIDAGRLNERVTLHRATKAANPGGLNPTHGQQQYAARWARVEQLGGSEGEHGDSVRGQTRYRITLRYVPELTATDTIRHRGRELEIVSVIDPDSSRKRHVVEAVHHA